MEEIKESKRVKLPLSRADIRDLRVGDEVELYGPAYIARDAAHKRLVEMIKNDETLPIDLFGASIYYAGPCPNAPGEIIGPAGPTTSIRMDAYTPLLIRKGLSAMIGKGRRIDTVKEAMKNRAVYFAATGGAGVLISQYIIDAEIVAFPELGPEAIHRVHFTGLPVIVAIDAFGGDIFVRKTHPERKK